VYCIAQQRTNGRDQIILTKDIAELKKHVIFALAFGIRNANNGSVAQLDRVPHYECGGCRFESCRGHKKASSKDEAFFVSRHSNLFEIIISQWLSIIHRPEVQRNGSIILPGSQKSFIER
jgi:hypothetical protein